MGLTVALSVVIAVALFMLTPFFISSLFGKVIKSPMALADPNCDFLYLYCSYFTDEGYTESIYVSWSGA